LGDGMTEGGWKVDKEWEVECAGNTLKGYGVM
jgi:hypothetical protein